MYSKPSSSSTISLDAAAGEGGELAEVRGCLHRRLGQLLDLVAHSVAGGWNVAQTEECSQGGEILKGFNNNNKLSCR
jgi:hypothetical protein